MPLYTEFCQNTQPHLTQIESEALLQQLPQWQIENDTLTKTFQFSNYYETMAFVNASAWISHQQDHHPDLIVRYKRCTVNYITHSVQGLSRNDFICAAKLDQLVDMA